MIELCFSESLAGSLKFASLMRKGETLAGCTAFAALGGTRRERAQARREARKPRVWPGETLDLSPADVRPLTLALDFGPLDDLPERRGALETLFGDFPEACETILRTNAETLRLLAEAKKTAAPVRAWISPHDPGDVCGLYFLCDFLAGAGAPLYVQAICPEENRVVLGSDADLYSCGLEAEGFNWIAFDCPPAQLRARAKVRYRQPEQWATVYPQADGRVRIAFDQPQRAITCGQAVVLYDGDTVLGGGVICRTGDDWISDRGEQV